MKETKKTTPAQDTEQTDKTQKNSAESPKNGSETQKEQNSIQRGSEEKKDSSEVQNLQDTDYTLGDSVPEEFQNQVKIIEGLELLITEKKDKLYFLQELTKPIPRAQRKLGKKSPLNVAKRKAAKLEIKLLNKEIFSLEENKRTAMGYLSKITSSGTDSIDLQLVRDRSVSQHYMNRNRNYILGNILKTINYVYSNPDATAQDRKQVNDLVAASKLKGTKAVRSFQDMLIEFLRTYKQEVAILSTGKEWFKKEATSKVKKALSSWRPRSGDLSF